MVDNATPVASGTVIMGRGADGKAYFLAVDSATGNLVAQLATAPTIDIGDVTLLPGSAVIGKIDHTTTGLGHGSKNVTTAGTDEAIAASTPAKWVVLFARTTNTNYIAVGGAGVDATLATGTGVLLAAGDKLTLAVDNLADVFIDALVSGEGVRFTYGS